MCREGQRTLMVLYKRWRRTGLQGLQEGKSQLLGSEGRPTVDEKTTVHLVMESGGMREHEGRKKRR